MDRGALDAARDRGLPLGGWCPKGRLAEDGPIDPSYPLIETDTSDYAQRTLANVRDSDATLVLAWGEPTGGTAYTIACANALMRPCLVIQSPARDHIPRTAEWLEGSTVSVLNVAGPRESTQPGARDATYKFICWLLDALVS